MASEWRTTTLGEVIELKRGYDLPSQDRREGPYPIVSSSGVSGCHAEAKAKAPGVVIGRYGTLGEVHYITQDYWPLNTSLYVRDFKGNDPKFISYFLRSLDFGAYSDKAAVPGLNRNDLHTAVVLVPPLAEQQRIAGILGALDDKIELNRRMSQTLESMARALFKSWFVDFDPVRAKAEGLDPSLPTDPAELFAKPFQDSQLGEIPSGWRASTVGQEFRVTVGQSPPGETYNMDGAGVPFYQGRADFGNRFPSRRVYCTAPTRRALAADTLVCVRAPVGDTNQAWEDCAIGRGLAAVRHRSGATSYTYLAMRCLRDSFAAFEAGGTVFGAIGKDDLRDVPVVAPAAGVVVAFEEVAARLDDKVASAQAQLSSLMAVRDALLPVLVSGARMAADSRTEGG
jgi:type I restriction enzyme S subunit